ncbi:MAG: LPS export ABC transporter protein LptC [Candidatus Kentron sp. G]|nr:MAG: LPS export ABC transporter protein LptC [Candidatus Kentron sp. G]VFN01744.1 MAG: LPS export ABC transporter protein LptC [Candidatus Kentron sp. G]
MIRQWTIPLILVALLVGSSWFMEELSLDTVERNNKAIQQKPDYSIDDFTTMVMDERGLPKWRIQAKHIVHYSATDMSELEQPYLIFFAMGSHDKFGVGTADKKLFQVYPIWHVKSEQGQVLDDGKTTFLLGKVHMWKNDDTGTMELDIRTRNLKVLPDSYYGETDEAAIIRTVTSETRGVGMRTHIKPNRMELLSQIQTIYKEVMHND